jgi:hypothetical protein
VDIDREPESVAMAFVVLTRRNIAALKSSLLAAFPDLRSGHADESIAAGFGFRTHAALLATVKAQGSAKLTVVLKDKAVAERLEELSGIKVEGERWLTVWREPLPDGADVFNFGDWWKNVANEN